jgi:hypothetical protein
MDPLSLSTIGAQTLTMGIQFLYAQAGEVLKRWRERREGGEPDPAVPTAEAGAAGLREAPENLAIDYSALERLGPEIRELRTSLAEYAEGIETVAVDDADLVRYTAGLRTALERVLGQDLTLEGEERPENGADIGVKLSVEDVAGYVAGVRSRELIDGRIRVEAKAGKVLSGGRFIAVDQTAGEDD